MKREEINQIQWECQQLLNRVTMLTDGAAWEDLAVCYTEDGELRRPSDPAQGIKGRSAILQSLRARPPRTSCHIIANSVFDVKSAEHVIARSRVLLIAGERAANLPVRADPKIMVGSFIDELARIEGNWLIRRRQGGMELSYSYERASIA